MDAALVSTAPQERGQAFPGALPGLDPPSPPDTVSGSRECSGSARSGSFRDVVLWGSSRAVPANPGQWDCSPHC